GEMLGMATLTELPMGGVLIQVRLEGVPPGEHAFHIHENGVCEPPDFESAGGHFNPYDVGHGFYDGDGVHAGDLPNVFVEEDGVLRADMVAPNVTTAGAGLNSVLTGDGTALVMHSDPDDYMTDPAGASGPRIACGVIGTITEIDGDEADQQ
ncbi:MAG: superoxide dismutase family protein, partial [Alphaproteobacteria bacterium]|nr:superoxide dismutase family protein [Alphaproteobacteria bacterium]